MGDSKQEKRHLSVLVVDDSAYNRKMIRAMLTEMTEVDRIEAVSDGEEAIRAVLTSSPDVITLDLNMPRMDGFTFLRWLMRNHPLPVIVVSAEGGEKNVFKALDLGAMDFLVKPVRYASERIIEIREELQEKIRAVAGKEMGSYLNILKVKERPVRPALKKTENAPVSPGETDGVLVVGASTGGPSAIQRVLARLPGDYPFPVIVVQHMPPVFTRQFAKRLDKNTALSGREAADGDRLERGLILVAPGGYHLVVKEGGDHTVEVLEKRDEDRYIPSVDVAMSSVARVYGVRAIGVVLTGMGIDGAEGLKMIKEAGGHTIAESEESSVVFGMPRAAVKKNAAAEILHVDDIGPRIVELTGTVTGLKNALSDGTK